MLCSFQRSSLSCLMSSVTCGRNSDRRCYMRAPGHASSRLLSKSSSTIPTTGYLSVCSTLLVLSCDFTFTYLWLISSVFTVPKCWFMVGFSRFPGKNCGIGFACSEQPIPTLKGKLHASNNGTSRRTDL